MVTEEGEEEGRGGPVTTTRTTTTNTVILMGSYSHFGRLYWLQRPQGSSPCPCPFSCRRREVRYLWCVPGQTSPAPRRDGRPVPAPTLDGWRPQPRIKGCRRAVPGNEGFRSRKTGEYLS